MTFDLEVSVGVTCDLGYPYAKFRLPRPFGFRVRADVRDIRRTTDANDRLMPPPPLRGGGIIKCNPAKLFHSKGSQMKLLQGS